MKKLLCLLLAGLCVLLCGCDLWMGGQYYHVTPHEEENAEQIHSAIHAESYDQVLSTLRSQIEAGNQRIVITFTDSGSTRLRTYADRAIKELQENHPITAYAVEEISYEFGTSGGLTAIEIYVTYRHDRSQILRIKHVQDMDLAQTLIGQSLENFDTQLTILVAEYEERDLLTMVREYVQYYPQNCVELPKVQTKMYPETGSSRILELRFTYKKDLQTLQTMQEYVRPIFTAAALYVRGEEEQIEKFTKLYSLLVTDDYRIEASAHPAYSLLHDGVGDSRGFADVYGAMCRQAGLDCVTVSGTYLGRTHYWNQICVDDVYYFVDILDCLKNGSFQLLSGQQLQSYQWDSAQFED